MKEHYDVIVAGGGPAGIGAVVAAARNGAKTILIENNGFLGGNATAGYVLKFHGFKLGGKKVVNGIPDELVERMKEKGGAKELGEKVDGVIFDPEVWKLASEEMLLESGCEILYHSFVSDVIKEGGKIKGVNVETRAKSLNFLASKVIDATGTGNLAIRAGANFQKGRPQDGKMQPMCLCFRLGNVEPFEWKVTRNEMEKWVKEGKISFFGGPWIDFINVNPQCKGEVLINTIRIWGDGSDSFDLTKAEIEGRKEAFILFQLLKKNITSFENSYFIDTAPMVGIRETNHIIGDYTLTKEDVLSGRKFQDGIACGCWPIDIHSPFPSIEWHSQPLKDYYHIPYRCLIPSNLENILVVGGGISTSHEAWASARVMATCMATGQAGGTAAALAVKEKITLHEIGEKFSILGESLIAQNVFL